MTSAANDANTGSGKGGGDKLPLMTCVGWGAGTLAVAALFNSVNVLLLRYLVDYVGIGAALAGSLLALSKLYDALIEPIVGSFRDRSKSRDRKSVVSGKRVSVRVDPGGRTII